MGAMAQSAGSVRSRGLTVRGRIVGVVVAVAAIGILVSGFAAYAVERQRVLDAVEDPVEHRTAAHRQQALGEVVGERAQAGRVPAREDDRLHARTAGRGSDCA